MGGVGVGELLEAGRRIHTGPAPEPGVQIEGQQLKDRACQHQPFDVQRIAAMIQRGAQSAGLFEGAKLEILGVVSVYRRKTRKK